MFVQQDQQVTVRALPEGLTQPARFHELNGSLLTLELPRANGEIAFEAGDLVEVTFPRTLYLGEVRKRSGSTMIVGIEHSLDRETLAVIREVWHGPTD
jgi:hypothetical protein